MKTTIIQGNHGTGKYPTAIKLAGKSETAIVPNWNGTIAEIGQAASYGTATLILHGVFFPEHENNVKYLMNSVALPVCSRYGSQYTLCIDHLIICTTSFIPDDLKNAPNCLLLKTIAKR
jgi:predicted ThiF/HesA family dinucleotide-utilizing enzyme